MYIDFKAYMEKVDAELIAKCGLNSDCLPDYLYYDAFDNDVAPKKCASLSLKSSIRYLFA